MTEFSTKKDQQITEHSPKVHDDLVQAYREFAQYFKTTPSVVYYPSCANDVSPSTAFPNSQIIYVEIDQTHVEALKKQGYEVYYDTAETFITPKPVDLLILLNPGIKFDRPARNVKVGGYVLCNDYHKTAYNLSKSTEFELLGMIDDIDSGKPKLITDYDDAKQKLLEDDTYRTSLYVFQRVAKSTLTDEKILDEDWQAARDHNEWRDNNENNQSVISIDDI